MDIVQLPLDFGPPTPAQLRYVCPVCGVTFYRFRSHPAKNCSRACAEKARFLFYEERFWSKVDKSGDCWLWTKQKFSNGYGNFLHGNHAKLAHRVSWELTNGPIPKGLSVLHRCDVRACVNPAHLFLGTHQDNMNDMKAKGRGARIYGSAHKNAVLTEAKVAEIKKLILEGARNKDLAAQFGIERSTISRIRHGQRWTHVT